MKNYIVIPNPGTYPQDSVGPINAATSEDAAHSYLRSRYGSLKVPVDEVSLIVMPEDSIWFGHFKLSVVESLEIEQQ